MSACISQDVEKRECTGCSPPARYVVAAVCSLYMALQYFRKTSFPVALVAMVRVSHPVNDSSLLYLNADTCPGTIMPSDSSENGEFDWSEATQGMIMAASNYGYLPSQMVAGHLLGSFSTKRLLCVSTVVTGTLALLTPLFARTAIALVFVALIVTGAFEGLTFCAIQLLIANWAPPNERPRFSGVVFCALDIGSLVGAALFGVLADWGGWPMVFYVLGGLLLASLLPILLLVYDTPAQHPRISDDERLLIMDALGQTADEKETKVVPWAAILKSPPFWAASLVLFGQTWVNRTLASELPSFARNVLHFDISMSGFVTALPYGFALATVLGSGFLMHRLDEKKCMSKINLYRLFNAISTVGPGITLLLLTLVNCHETLTIVLIVLTASLSGSFYGTTFLNYMEFGANFSGTLAGLQQVVGGIPSLVAPVLIGYIIDGDQSLSAWNGVFYMSAGTTALPYLAFLLFGSVEEQEWNKPKAAEK